MSRLRNRLFIIATMAVLATAPLAGCGKKNEPKPPSKDSSFPKAYPSGAPRSDAAPNGTLSMHQLAFLKGRNQ
ncbi:MAG: hypothetical protein HOM25_16210 [Rhodospirillaceae bacterium]|jgi:hypothetical protein|nr:hypothetical protein [Rhodospirillaceae bacterium]MBT5666616.1 hypothetical protein [Rhodospirillaceae bacterium]MBT5812509.1 hypothetical protein [Rhodospirillaceae bacterium]